MINGVTVKVFDEVKGNAKIGTFEIYSYEHPSKVVHSQIKIVFLNDYHRFREDRNLRVDKIIVDGEVLQTENSSVYSTGTWSMRTGCKAGYKKSEWLHCGGYFQY